MEGGGEGGERERDEGKEGGSEVDCCKVYVHSGADKPDSVPCSSAVECSVFTENETTVA